MNDPAAPGFEFESSVLDAVIAHMNADHLHDSLAIVRHLGGAADATTAMIESLDRRGVVFVVDGSGDSGRRILVPWHTVPVTRVDIRHELVRMTEECTPLSP